MHNEMMKAVEQNKIGIKIVCDWISRLHWAQGEAERLCRNRASLQQSPKPGSRLSAHAVMVAGTPINQKAAEVSARIAPLIIVTKCAPKMERLVSLRVNCSGLPAWRHPLKMVTPCKADTKTLQQKWWQLSFTGSGSMVRGMAACTASWLPVWVVNDAPYRTFHSCLVYIMQDCSILCLLPHTERPMQRLRRRTNISTVLGAEYSSRRRALLQRACGVQRGSTITSTLRLLIPLKQRHFHGCSTKLAVLPRYCPFGIFSGERIKSIRGARWCVP